MAEENKKPETEKKIEEKPVEKKDEKNVAGEDKNKGNKQVIEKPAEIKEEKGESDSQQVSGIKTEEKVKTESEPIQPKPETKKPEAVPDKEYIIPIRKHLVGVPRYKKTNKAVKIVKQFLARHMKIYDRDLNKIKIDRHLNEALWFRGIRNPPARIKVKVTRDGENVRAELSEMPKKIEFKKGRLEKREQRAMEFAAKKKKTLAERLKGAGKPDEKLEEKVGETKEPGQVQTDSEQSSGLHRPSAVVTEEQKAEEKEKAKAGEEAMKKLEKEAAKATKHITKEKSKQPKRQQRKTLAK